MKINNLTLITFLICGVTLHAQTPVFISGTEGYKSFRIPAIVRVSNGDLLAFAEGRVAGSGDFGDIDIVMKRSKDKGKSWSAAKVVAGYDNLQAGNAAPVIDLTDPAFPKGRLFLFFNTGNNHEGEVRKGKGLREVWYKTSVDAGISWSDPVNITTQVHKPKQSEVNAAYNYSEDWRSYANTPGHGMQLMEGPYKGRIYIAANHSQGEPKPKGADYQAHGFYSDDHGKTFKISETISIEGSNESTAAEISGGRIMFNARNQKGDVRARIVAISSDGGVKWDTTYFDRNLPDPVCEGSILTIGKNKKQNILAFSNAADTKSRDNLTLRISFDDGKTWKKHYVIDKSSKGEKDYTAYSDIVKTAKKSVGILYEFNDYKSIVFKEMTWGNK
ncbi:sialidase family protein [Dyadobacter frigoris]|uniref:exo-alpha-sialidase n=1 Tax=Dyadobacter frigoris TaxID=2576211 RepID=A0A4U6D2D0_9BACT|nr:sialidase family protein [Dyadobacter frigoris]TKT88014.1 exo-alpha-sialidase [Dyadobacter frigoris]GLU52912.1 sialidase [Dyadobacter frigoris]